MTGQSVAGAPALRADLFAQYPPDGRRLAMQHLDLLTRLPPIFAAVLLREIITFDWKFPAERLQLSRELASLGSLPASDLALYMKAFAALRLSPELQEKDFISNPSAFMESLTAWLWSSGQMENFRSAADAYAAYLATAVPTARPKTRRLGIVVVGSEVVAPAALHRRQSFFRKLRPYGVHLSRINPENGFAVLLDAAAKRSQQPKPTRDYLHWYIDGGVPAAIDGPSQLSYAKLQRPLDLLLQLIQQDINSGSMGPERLRSTIAQMQPEEIGLGGADTDPVLDRFSLSLLTEGSGTQIFATTFVQWAARECLRRAQPETILLRYAPRRQVEPMNVMLSNAEAPRLDPLGSLVDAEMGAYYTWLDLNRLSGADEMSFLAWAEGQSEAVAIGPGLPHGTTSDSRMNMHQVLAMLS